MTEPDSDRPQPALRIVAGGDPTDEEVAALVAAFAVVADRTSDEQSDRQPSRWASRAELLRRPLHPGPGAWRAYRR